MAQDMVPEMVPDALPYVTVRLNQVARNFLKKHRGWDLWGPPRKYEFV